MEILRKQQSVWRTIHGNSNPIITRLIKEENRTNEREAIKDGIAKGKVSGLETKKKVLCLAN